MNIPRVGPISDGLIYETSIPLSWQLIADNLQTHELTKIADSNRQVLQILLNENVAQEPKPTSDQVGDDIRRLESKVDLLISLVGTLLLKEAGTPESRKVWLGGAGLQVLLDSTEDLIEFAKLPVISVNDYGQEISAVGSLIMINLYLDAHFPQPLSFLARANIVRHVNSESLLVATFEDQEAQNLLEKFIFQQHRRVIASARED